MATPVIPEASQLSSCPSCSEPNQARAAFCSNCGEALAKSCRACGAKIEFGSRFCDVCGHDVAMLAEPALQAASAPTSAPVAAPAPYAYAQPVPPMAPVPVMAPPVNTKSKVVAGVLGLLLGGFGVHKFYLGRTGQGVLYLLFSWTLIPSIVGFIEGITYLITSDVEWARRTASWSAGKQSAAVSGRKSSAGAGVAAFLIVIVGGIAVFVFVQSSTWDESQRSQLSSAYSQLGDSEKSAIDLQNSQDVATSISGIDQRIRLHDNFDLTLVITKVPWSKDGEKTAALDSDYTLEATLQSLAQNRHDVSAYNAILVTEEAQYSAFNAAVDKLLFGS